MTDRSAVERLREGLREEYRFEPTPTGSGDAGVLPAHDLTLDRPVSIHWLDTQRAKPSSRDAFAEQARLLANLNSPHILAVHRASSTDGVSYAVTPRCDGETLEQRLVQGRIPVSQAVQLVRDLLAALRTAHAAGITFSELGPANLLLRDGGVAVMAFGRAVRESDSTSGVSNPSLHRGPRAGSLSDGRGHPVLGQQRDLYCAGTTLYHALTGRPWTPGTRVPWRGVPYWLRRPLKRALAAEPGRRWPDALGFHHALEDSARARSRGNQIRAFVLVVAIGAVVASVWPNPLPPIGGAPPTLAIIGFDRAGLGAPDSLGNDLARIVRIAARGIPDLTLTSEGRLVRGDTTDAGALWSARGAVDRRGDTVIVDLTLRDSAGRPFNLSQVRGATGDLGSLADTLVVRMLEVVRPRGVSAGQSGLEGVPLIAIKPFLQGEEAFAGDHWKSAQEAYDRALSADPGFALARWRQANVKRWRRESYDSDLRARYLQDQARLRPLDRMLVEALLESDLERRFENLKRAVAEYHEDAYARFLYAEELYHRGPLVGRPFDEGIRVMLEAIARDSALAQAYDHLVMAAIREGRKDDAARAIELRVRAAVAREPDDLDVVPFLKLAYDERFRPLLGWVKLQILRHSPAKAADVRRIGRMGLPWLDLANTQVALSELLLESARTPEERGSALEGRGLALVALGRPQAALEEMDSAAALLGGVEADLQQLEWPVVLSAIGHPGPPARRPIGQAVAAIPTNRDDTLAARRTWIEGLGGLVDHDSLALGRALVSLATMRGPGPELAILLRALRTGAQGHAREALSISDTVRVVFQQTRPPDPFTGALFHLLRGDWALAVGDSSRAEREWLWYEGSDAEGWPGGVAQAGEIDGALGVFARSKRGRLLLARARTAADTTEACRHLRRVAEHWAGAEPSMQPLRMEVVRAAASCPR